MRAHVAADAQTASRSPALLADEQLLHVQQIVKRFPQRRPWRDIVRAPLARTYVDALRGVSFHVGAGEFYGLLGANGAGKTTLMKVIATLIVPDGGSVTVAGHDVERDAAAVRSLMSLSLASERGLYWRLSARENLKLFAALHAIEPGLVSARVNEALRDVGLVEAADRMVREFSSGMVQRLIIARALLPQPRLLLLDEPTRSLDPVAAREFRRFLRDELAHRRQCAVLLATHDADEAFNLCRRVAILDRGAVVAEGSAHDLAYDVLGARHVMTVDQPDHDAFARLSAGGDIEVLGRESMEGKAWARLTLRVRGGDDAVSDVLATVVRAGVRVQTMEKAQASLADLIAAVLGRQRGGSDAR